MLLFFISLLKNRVSLTVNRGCWIGKVVVVFVLFYFSLKLGLEFFHNYYKASIVLSPVFLLLTVIILIEMLYIAAKRLSSKYFDDGNRAYLAVMIILTLGSIGLTSFFGYRIYMLDCTHYFFYTLVFGILGIVGFTLAKLNQEANVFTTATVIFAIVYLQYLGMSSFSDSGCRLIERPTKATRTDSYIYYLVTILITTSYLSLKPQEGEDETQKLFDTHDGTRIYEIANNTEVDADVSVDYGRETIAAKTEDIDFNLGLVKFHLLFVLASTFIMVLMTSWQFGENIDGNHGMKSLESDVGAWIQIGVSLTGMAVFLWTLLAPWVFPDRDFSTEY